MNAYLTVGAPSKARHQLPTGSFPDGIAENSAAVAPIKTDFAFFVSGLLKGIESLNVVDHSNDTSCELPHRFKR
jgi:hypothetical protein